MKDKPYPITGHACFYPERFTPYWESVPGGVQFLRLRPAPLLKPKAVVKRAKKRGKK